MDNGLTLDFIPLEYCQAPTSCPPIQGRSFSHLPSDGAYGYLRPSEAGFRDEPSCDGLRAVTDQEAYTKLYYARYMRVTDVQLSNAMGVSKRNDMQTGEYRSQLHHIKNLFQVYRSKTFGPGSYLYQLVRHSVETVDFNVALFNLERRKRIYSCRAETLNGEHREPMEAEVRKTESVINEHLDRLKDVCKSDAQKAVVQLSNMEAINATDSHEVRIARESLKHCQIWASDVSHIPKLPTDVVSIGFVPEKRPVYAYKSMRAKQDLWEKVFSQDVFACMLWPLRDFITSVPRLCMLSTLAVPFSWYLHSTLQRSATMKRTNSNATRP